MCQKWTRVGVAHLCSLSIRLRLVNDELELKALKEMLKKGEDCPTQRSRPANQ